MNPEFITIRIVRRIDAPPQRVFGAWLDPQMLGRWMFGPSVRTEGVVRVTLDPRPGGAISFVRRRADEEITNVGEYREIDSPRRIVLVWGQENGLPDENVLSVDFRPVGEGCELHLVHTFVPPFDDYANIVEGTWQRMLTALEAVLR